MISPYSFAGLMNIEAYKAELYRQKHLQFDFDRFKEFLNQDYGFIFERNRKRKLVNYRYSIIEILKSYDKTFCNIMWTSCGRLFGLNHATAIHAVECVNTWKEYPDSYQPELEVYYSINNIITNYINNEYEKVSHNV